MDNTQTLIKLQEADSQLLEIKELLGDLPHKVEKLTTEETRLKEDIENRKVRIKDIEVEISKKDLQVRELTTKIDKLKDQLFLVKTNKQYDALSKEIDYLKEELDGIETKELEMVEEKDTLVSETDEREGNLESLTEDLQKRKTNLENLLNESSEKKTELENERAGIIKDLSSTILSKYERVFEARNGVAVIEALDSSCGGCGSMVPPQKIAELKQSMELHSCDVCSRFLFWPPSDD